MIVKKRRTPGYSVIFVCAISFVLQFSCVSPKRVIYLNDIPDTLSNSMTVPLTPYEEPKIQSNDILAITVQTIEQNASNTPITTNSTGTFNPLNGFLVDANGFIELSLIGFVKVGGLTTTEAREVIKQKAREFYKEPVVNCRIANFEVMVLGDVGKPGKTTFPDEKATIFDAVTQVGDINLTARKDNILLVRSEGSSKKFARLNLLSSSIYQSPYYYLRQKDLLIVQPRKAKIKDTDNRLIKYLSLTTTIVSLSTLFVSFKLIK